MQGVGEERLVASLDDEEKQPTFEAVASEAGTTVGQVARVLNPPHLDSLSVLSGGHGGSEPGDRFADTSVSVDDRSWLA